MGPRLGCAMHKRRERRSCYCPAWPGEAAAAGGLALRGRGGRGEGTAGGQSLPWPCGGGGGQGTLRGTTKSFLRVPGAIPETWRRKVLPQSGLSGGSPTMVLTGSLHWGAWKSLLGEGRGEVGRCWARRYDRRQSPRQGARVWVGRGMGKPNLWALQGSSAHYMAFAKTAKR